MTKVLPIAAALLLMPFLCSCDDASTLMREDNEYPLVVSTIFPGYDFARNIGDEKAGVIQLLPLGAESHTYEPTPQDMMLVKKCDVFIYAGGESDTWIEEILSEDDAQGRVVVSMTEVSDTLVEEEKEGMHEGGVLSDLFGEDEEEEETDEHTWTSPKNAVRICDAICDALCEVSPENAGYYKDNCGKYTGQLKKLDERFSDTVSKCPRKCIVVADRFPFRYLVNDYGLDYRAAFPGCADNAEVAADSIVTMCDYVKDNNIPVIFTIEFSSGKIADCVAEVTGAKILTLHSCHNVSSTDEKYIDIMERNLINLSEALK